VHAELPPSTQQSTQRCRISLLACDTPTNGDRVRCCGESALTLERSLLTPSSERAVKWRLTVRGRRHVTILNPQFARPPNIVDMLPLTATGTRSGRSWRVAGLLVHLLVRVSTSGCHGIRPGRARHGIGRTACVRFAHPCAALARSRLTAARALPNARLMDNLGRTRHPLSGPRTAFVAFPSVTSRYNSLRSSAPLSNKGLSSPL
jgi:hypothetical protein